MPSQSPALTPLELRLMQVLWRLGSSNVATVQAELDPPLAYTTVQTMLNILERKGHLKRRMEGRAFLYTPKSTQDRAQRHALRDLVDRMFAGSGEQLVMALVRERDLNHEDLARLARLLGEEESGDKANDTEA